MESRHNPLEAETIAAWLVAHKDDIERHYGEPLYKVVGVVTPFSAQVNAIKCHCVAEINGKDEQGLLTVGTVHSLQGRKGRLFSFLLSTQNMKMAGFLIATALSSMLLSHALKIVFWYLAIWTLSRCSPHFRREGYWQISLFFDNNALQFEFQKRQDLISAHTQISTLHGVEQHDEF